MWVEQLYVLFFNFWSQLQKPPGGGGWGWASPSKCELNSFIYLSYYKISTYSYKNNLWDGLNCSRLGWVVPLLNECWTWFSTYSYKTTGGVVSGVVGWGGLPLLAVSALITKLLFVMFHDGFKQCIVKFIFCYKNLRPSLPTRKKKDQGRAALERYPFQLLKTNFLVFPSFQDLKKL